jgi:hypothetical protein
MYTAMEKFLAKHLGGRYQKEVSPKIAEHLAKLTVDPKTVKLPSEEAKALLAKALKAPLPQADGSLIKASSLAYQVILEMGPKKLDLKVDRKFELVTHKQGKRVRVTEKVKMPQGEQVDVFDFEGKTLRPVERKISGMATVNLSYTAEAISGEMGAGGRTMPVNKKLEAPVLGDGVGLELTIAGLKLDKDYATTLRIFEPMTQKVRAMQLKVTGQETTKVAAGSFKTWILELKPLDEDKSGQATLYVLEEAPHHVVKSAYRLPAMMGGGMMKSELTSKP